MKLLASEETKSCAKILMDNFEAMILNAFIDGLFDNLSTMTRIYRPKSLLEAYQCALDLHNANLRKRSTNNNVPQHQRNFTSNRPISKPALPNSNNNNSSNPGPTVPVNYNNNTNNNNFRSNNYQRPALPWIKPDPSGQYKPNQARQINLHENVEADESDLSHAYDKSSDQREEDTVDTEEINFHMMTNDRQKE